MKIRLFLTCWIVFSLHFATNIVREHYPAFSLIDSGTLQLDDYAGLHPDIFEHRDGHYYIGNQVLCSVFAAVPLLVFDPLLDWLERYRKRQLASGTVGEEEFESEYPMRRAFFRKVQQRGLDLRFGAAAAVTSVFLMAPLSALVTVLMFSLLLQRGIGRGRAVWLALLFAFATPVFYRSATLNHNVFMMAAVFGSFVLLWARAGEPVPLSARRRFGAGFLAGCSLALDYAGVVTLLGLFVYLLATHRTNGSWRAAIRSGWAFVLGTIAPVAFLLYSQWAMFGNPFLPGQFWMPRQNEYVDAGMRGFTAPDLELLWLQFSALGFGLVVYGPLLLLAFVPGWWYRTQDLVLPRRERVFVAALASAFLIFCSCNQYARLQWNTGFRYLMPLVPLWFLALSDHLKRAPVWLLAALTVPAVAHSWALSMVRYINDGGGPIVAETWRRVAEHGVQLPWLSVIRRTPTLPYEWLRSSLVPYAVLAIAAAAITLVWRLRRR